MTRAALAILAKDLQTERRTGEAVPAMALFSVAVFVLFRFGLDRESLEAGLAAGVLWVTLLLAALLGVSRLFAAEREQDLLDGVLLAPIDRTGVWIAKAIALLLYLIVVELIAVPAFALLLLGPPLTTALPALALTLLLANIGIAAVGTLVAALAAESRARELITALLLVPLSVPVVLAGSAASAPLFTLAQQPEQLGRWLALLGTYNVIFILIAVAVFDYLFED